MQTWQISSTLIRQPNTTETTRCLGSQHTWTIFLTMKSGAISMLLSNLTKKAKSRQIRCVGWASKVRKLTLKSIHRARLRLLVKTWIFWRKAQVHAMCRCCPKRRTVVVFSNVSMLKVLPKCLATALASNVQGQKRTLKDSTQTKHTSRFTSLQARWCLNWQKT